MNKVRCATIFTVMVIGLMFSTITAQAGQMFQNPTINGYRLDICKVWGQQCGQPAADAFCQHMGYSYAEGYEQAYDIGAHSPTMIISSGQICDQGFCDGFTWINCSGGSSGYGNNQGSAQTFHNPSISGYRLDICKVWGQQCGQPAADAFCQYMGYSSATDYVQANDIGAHTPTIIISSGQICDQGFCDGFSSITCR